MARASLIAAPEPTAADLDRVVRDLTRSWTGTVVIRRQAREDVGYREIFVSVDNEPSTLLRHGDMLTREVTPGRHRLTAHNTLFRKRLDFTIAVGEQLSFTAVNRAGFGTYSPLALFIGFLGAGPLYLTLACDSPSDHA